MPLQLSCVAGNQQVTANLSWLGQIPSGIVEYIIFYYEQDSTDINSISTQSLQAIITGLTNDIVYNFYAIAYRSQNVNGDAFVETSVVQCIAGNLPSIPANLLAVVSAPNYVKSQEVDLSWDASASDVNYPVLKYRIYQSIDDITYSLIAEPTGLSHNVLNLTNGQQYYFKVSAVNAIGESDQCQSVNATPTGLASPVRSVIVNFNNDASNNQQAGYQSVDISWDAPIDNGGNGVTGYIIQYSLDPTFQTGVISVNQGLVSQSNIQDVNLMVAFADTKTSTSWYFFRICAVTSLGNGAFSITTTIQATDLPLQVQNLSASNLNGNGAHQSGTVTLNWDYAIDDACPLLGYIVTYLDENNVPESLFVFEPDSPPTITMTGLQNGHNYNFNVMAMNMRGMGQSAHISQIPSYYASAPVLSVTGHTDVSVSMSWTVPADNGSAITGYNVYKSDDGISYILISENQVQTTYVDNAVVLGQIAYYKVLAVNANGLGAYSNIVSEYPSRIPDAPQNVMMVATNKNANGQQLTITFDAPANGGAPITDYQLLFYSASDFSTWLDYKDIALNTSYVLNQIANNPLVNGTMYFVLVRAFNRDGFTDSSDQFSMVGAYPQGLPDAPVNLVAETGDTQILLSWDQLNIAPASHPNDGANGIIKYQIYRDNVHMFDVNYPTHSYIDAPVTNGINHDYRVSAVNANGEGALSLIATQSASREPDQVGPLTAMHGDSQVTLFWNAPYNEGRPITSYNIYKSIDGGNNYTLVGSTSNLTYLVGGLVNGNLVYLKVSAVNIRGEGLKSTAVSLRPSTSPDQPRSVTIYPYDSGVDISWQAPLNDSSGNPSGGLAFTYNVKIYNTSNQLVYQASGITNPLLHVTGLNDNDTYHLHLYANNGVDINYHEYLADINVIPNPIAVDNLQSPSRNSQRIMLQFSYKTAVFSITEFVLSVADATISQGGYAIIQADQQPVISGDDYTYSFALNSATVNIPQLQLTDNMILTIFAINQLGESSPAGMLVLN